MSSFAKAKKSFQKNHKERGQLNSRKHLGLLEKHKDYVLRARDYHRKKASLKLLKEKALNKNPDEFYFKMVNTKTQDGVHRLQRKEKYTAAELKLMKSQDLNYINYKRTTEAKKIEQLQASHHLLEQHDESSSPNKHIVFVDSVKEAKSFDAVKYFDTVPELVSRTYNRPKIDTLKSQLVVAPEKKKALQKLEKQRARGYEELRQRIDREKKMQKVAQELDLQKKLMGKGPRKKLKSGDDSDVPVYKWKKQRKR